MVVRINQENTGKFSETFPSIARDDTKFTPSKHPNIEVDPDTLVKKKI